ncbi:MAG: HIT family protein [Steroidobacteraceae bacterium]
MTVGCAFCEIVRGSQPASIVWEDDFTIAAVDLRQFHAGHVLVIPRRHLGDVRELDYVTGAAHEYRATGCCRSIRVPLHFQTGPSLTGMPPSCGLI